MYISLVPRVSAEYIVMMERNCHHSGGEQSNLKVCSGWQERNLVTIYQPHNPSYHTTKSQKNGHSRASFNI